MSVQIIRADSVAVVIPAFNEAQSITAVVESVTQYMPSIVVDDGSTDETAKLAKEAGADVVSHDNNCGYDCALESGLIRALELGYCYAITMDGDGQHIAETLNLFKIELVRGADLVIGIRDRPQRFSESIFSVVGKAIWSINDPLCGMKGYRLSLLKRIGRFNNYESIGTELSLRLVRSGCRFTQVPVTTSIRKDVSRFGVGFRANWIILRSLVLGLIYAKIIE